MLCKQAQYLQEEGGKLLVDTQNAEKAKDIVQQQLDILKRDHKNSISQAVTLENTV